ncbi:MAG: hypothetical protein ACI3YH_03245 [Eubacteriales bacterium]
MAKRYEPGRIVGDFEVIEWVGRRHYTASAMMGVYRVRCRSCGRECEKSSYDLRSKYGCICMDETKSERYAKRVRVNKERKPWMDEGLIYRSWKEMTNRAAGVTILAQLNDVPVKMIRRIIADGKRKEETAEKS